MPDEDIYSRHLSVGQEITRAAGSVVGGISSTVTGALSGALNLAGMSVNTLTNLLTSTADRLITGAENMFGIGPTGLNRLTQDAITNRNGFLEGSDPLKTILGAIKGVVPSVGYSFPPDQNKFYIQFSMGQYQRPGAFTRAEFDPDYRINLPIPAKLVDTTSVDIRGGESTGPLIGDLLEQFGNPQQGIANNAVAASRLVYNAGMGIAQDRMNAEAGYTIPFTGGARRSSVIGKNPGDALGNAIGQYTGAVPNPHVTTVMHGIKMREHSFSWLLSPRNAKESQELLQNLRTIKARSLPKYVQNSTALLTYPNLVEIRLFPELLNQYVIFKRCLIKDCQIDITPYGPSFFKDGPGFVSGINHPTIIQFSLSLVETEIVTSRDWGGAEASFGIDTSSPSIGRDSFEKDKPASVTNPAREAP
jgi:hypothetical protein